VIKLSVQVSYKKQATLGIIGIAILLLAIEAIANVWWVTQIHCEFEQNEIFQNFDDVEKRQLCLDFYNLKTSGDELIPDQSTYSITINGLGFRGAEFSEIKPPNTYRIFLMLAVEAYGAKWLYGLFQHFAPQPMGDEIANCLVFAPTARNKRLGQQA